MKANKLIFSGLFLALFMVSCTEKPKFPLEGTWQMVYADQMASDGSTFPDQIQGGQIKTWTQFNFSFVGQFIRNGVAEDTYGAGNYALEGNQYIEKLHYHYQKSYLGEDVRLLIEFKGDTMIQRWPVDENWKLPKKHCTEKYIRLYN
jgi:hypothetical protein